MIFQCFHEIPRENISKKRKKKQIVYTMMANRWPINLSVMFCAIAIKFGPNVAVVVAAKQRSHLQMKRVPSFDHIDGERVICFLFYVSTHWRQEKKKFRCPKAIRTKAKKKKKSCDRETKSNKNDNSIEIQSQTCNNNKKWIKPEIETDC